MTSDDVNMFKENQKLMNDVFYKTLQTGRGKTHAREHEGDYNIQSVCQKLNSFYTESTNAHVRAFTALSYASSAKIES